MYKATRGSALLTALFIMTLVAIVATAMSLKVQTDIYRTRLTITHDKLYLASQAVAFWAISELTDDKNHFSKLLKDGALAHFPRKMETIQQGLKLTGSLYDLQAQYNLNNLADRNSILTFNNLLNQAAIKMSMPDKMQVTLATENWVTNFDPSHGVDHFNAYYQSQKPPYNTSHQFMQSKSEFRLVRGVSAALYRTLEPWFTVLPQNSLPVNINTVSKEVLMALGGRISDQKINSLIAARNTKEINQIVEISDLLKATGLGSEQFTTESTYFLSVAHVNMDEFNLVVYTLLKRARDKHKVIKVHILRQSFNAF